MYFKVEILRQTTKKSINFCLQGINKLFPYNEEIKQDKLTIFASVCSEFITEKITNIIKSYIVPREIVQYMIELVNPKSGETVFDPSCGSANTFVRVLEYMNKNNSEIKANVFYGNCIDNYMTHIAKFNCMINSINDKNIKHKSSLLDKESNKYDIVICSSTFGEIVNFYKFDPGQEYYKVKSSKSELLHIQLMFNSLKDGGRGIIIVQNVDIAIPPPPANLMGEQGAGGQ